MAAPLVGLVISLNLAGAPALDARQADEAPMRRLVAAKERLTTANYTGDLDRLGAAIADLRDLTTSESVSWLDRKSVV